METKIRLSDIKWYAMKYRDQGVWWYVPKFGMDYQGAYRQCLFSHNENMTCTRKGG